MVLATCNRTKTHSEQVVTFYYLLDDFRLDRCSDLTSSHFYELLSTFPAGFKMTATTQASHSHTSMFKDRKKVRGWALFLLSLIRKKKSIFPRYSTHFLLYLIYPDSHCKGRLILKFSIQSLWWQKGSVNKGEDQLNKNRDQVRSCRQVAGLHLTGCATNSDLHFPESSVALLSGFIS